MIHTCCHHENRVEQRLRQNGLEIFLPRLTVVRQWRDRKKLLQVPLFPGYLFVRAVLETPTYYDIIKLPGVVRILGNKGRLETVPPETIESIKLTVASDRPYYPYRYLLKGKWVRVVEGPLAGIIGIIREHKEQKRKLVIEVELFRRAMAVELEDEAVELWH
ncbi:MAG: transcription termination/antitermination NusG family protein [Syntrophobacterales bacterium]